MLSSSGSSSLSLSHSSSSSGGTSSVRPLYHPDNPMVFFDISIGDTPLGRLKMELFKHAVPKTSENFRQFCTGEHKINNVPVGYKGTTFHRVIKGFMIQGGDFVHGDGTGCLSIYGEKFRDENFIFKHETGGFLSMANSGSHTNGCQFFITCEKCEWLDNKHVIFGKVLDYDSMQLVRKIENVSVNAGENRPKIPVIITQCGEL